MRRNLALLATSILFLAGCQSTPSNTPAFFNEEFGVSMDNPVGWEQKSFPGVLVAFRSPDEGPEDQFLENVNLTVESAQGLSTEEYSEAVKATMEKMLTDYKLIKTGTMVIDGQTVPTLDITHTQGQFKLKGRQAYIVQNDIAYSLTYSAAEESFEKFLEDGLKIMATLKIE